MEDTYGCNLINTKRDGRQVTEFVGKYHVHILVRQGQMTFSDGKNSFTSRQGDLAIWQMSNTIQRVECSEDFNADVLLLSWQFLQQFNPEMVWASKGFVFIRINPSFHLDDESQSDADIHIRFVDDLPTRPVADGHHRQFGADIPALSGFGSAECQDGARGGLLCRPALHHTEISVASEPNRHRVARLAMDTVLCIIRIGVTIE